MKTKQYFYSFGIAFLIIVVIFVAIDLVRFNITQQSLYDAIVTKGAAQYKESYSVIAYVIENDNDSTIYIYIQSTLTNRYRLHTRFVNVYDAPSNRRGITLTVIGAYNFFTLSRGSVYDITLWDDTFWHQEPLGDYTLRILMLRQYGFDFWLFFWIMSLFVSMIALMNNLFDCNRRRLEGVPPKPKWMLNL